MPSAPVNGTVLHYEVMGDGPTCLVLHGWLGADHTYLRPDLDRLGEHLRLVYLDHRCNGRSGGATADTQTVGQLADDADALAAHLGVSKVLVLGHHQGVSVAQELVLRHPERVAGLILVGGTPGELGKLESLADSFDAPPTPPEVEVLQRVPPGSDEEWAATMAVLAKFFFRRVGQAEEREPFARTVFNAEAAVQAMVSLGWWSCVDRLAEVRAPALVLDGRHDVFYGPHESDRISRHLPGARMVVLEDGGHLPWVEEPDRFMAAVREWLGDLHLAQGDGGPIAT